MKKKSERNKIMDQERWKYIIQPRRKLFDLKLKEILKNRDLIFLLAKRDFISNYKQTILGPLWALINPISTTVVFTIIFGNLAKLPTMDVASTGNIIVPSFLFYMSGTILWNYFTSTVKNTANTFLSNARIMSKVYYPRFISPLSFAIYRLIALGINFALFAVLLVICSMTGMAVIHLSASLLLFPLLILQLILFSLGIGIIISAATTKYRDLFMLMDFGLQLWQYATPIAYGLLMIPQKWMGLYMLNPVTNIITTMRYICFGEGYFHLGYYLGSWGITILIFLIGLIVFSLEEQTFVDTI